MDLPMHKSDIIKTSHAFFGRNGGVSTNIYSSLNCALSSGDAPENVAENRRRVAEKMMVENSNLVTLAQIHSNICLTITDITTLPHRQQADAMATNISGVALGILTADCAPVLLHDAKNNVIGAAHAGWKGAIAGVIENTIAAMLAIGAEKQHIAAVIGPCIAQNSYEVDADFRENFIQQKAEDSCWFDMGADSSHWQFDLAGFVMNRLVATGIGSYAIISEDTYSQPEHFFSYRRATHLAEADYGRQISAIALA